MIEFPNTVNEAKEGWMSISPTQDFSLYNLPYGVFSYLNEEKKVGIALADKILDVRRFLMVEKDFILNDKSFDPADFETNLNSLFKNGNEKAEKIRNLVFKHFSKEQRPSFLTDDIIKDLIYEQTDCELHLPFQIGDYTDFYASEHHAFNVGSMFRDPENALNPNWKHLPVGYHGRASSIVPSGRAIQRPAGQIIMDNKPVLAKTRKLDIEAEFACIIGKENKLGSAIPIENASTHIAGFTMFNDWSARDIQKWEYVPLGPFLGKSFASSMSSWVLTLAALEPFRIKESAQDPQPLDYLNVKQKLLFDINYQYELETASGNKTTLTNTNTKYLYWDWQQMIAHHSINGCNLRTGDVLASGTISGPESTSLGSLLELSRNGAKPLKVGKETRSFIEEGDTISCSAFAEKNGVRVGFGEMISKIIE